MLGETTDRAKRFIMTGYEVVKTSARDGSLPIEETVLQKLFPAGYKLEWNQRIRLLSLLQIDPPHILAQEHFTKNEWNILIALLVSYPQYAPHEILLASVTSLSVDDCRTRLQKARQRGTQALKRELKPVQRALCGIRVKIINLSPHLRVALIRDAGYMLTRCSA
jgi:hypothetical protein